MRIALFGPPGAGKGTQSKLLTNQFGLETISTGNLIREAMREENALGVQARKYVDAGELVPDVLVRDLANQAIAFRQFDRFILDGYPRTIQQATWLDEFLMAYKAPLHAVISLDVPDEVIMDRLSNRRINRETGESYHLKYHPPPRSLDSGLIIQRSDDKPDAVQARLIGYRRETKPVEDFFRRRNILVQISGEGDVESVFEGVLQSVEEFARPVGV